MYNRLRMRRRARAHRTLFSLSFLLGCVLLLSACLDAELSGNSAGQKGTHRSAPTINLILTRQGEMEGATFQKWIALIQRYQSDASKYHQEYNHDQQALIQASSDGAYQAALQTLAQHISSIRMQALKAEASTLEQQLNQQASAWGRNHTFHDSYNSTTYQLGYEYGQDGVGGSLQDEMSSARTLADYQQAVEDGNAFLTSFQAYQANALDKTSWDKRHQTDIQLLRHYRSLQQKVVIVSLGEQALRVYNHGRLVRAFQVTTGRPEKPSLPGSWVVEEKRSPTVFKSDEPKGSPYWYPDTPIHYAMLYHSGGYFIHDSWWRADYGPDTQFPHLDSSGDAFSFDGSHGCINVATPDAEWLYNFVDVNTRILIY